MHSDIRKLRLMVSLLPILLTAGCNLGTAPHPATGATAIPAEVTVTGATESSTTCQTSASGILRLCFLNLADGQTFDLQPGKAVSIQAEASGAAVTGISLAVEGEDSSLFLANDSGVDPFQATLSWIPGGGSKLYQLKLQTMTPDKLEIAEIALTLHVEGLPVMTTVPTIEPGMVPQEIRDMVVEKYEQEFGLILPFPAIARKYRSGVTDPWVSTAYIANAIYEVDVYPDGRIEAWTTPLFPDLNVDYEKSIFKEPLCKPAGTYDMLVVFLDFGNLQVTQEEVLADLETATRMTNQAFAAYPSAEPGSDPILQIHTTGVVIPVPSDLADHLITPEQVQQYAHIDPAGYRWLAQVDLDSASTARMAWGGMEKASFGYAYTGCPAEQIQPNIWMTVDDKSELVGVDNRLSQTLLSHEVYHLFGLPGSHIWACTDGPQADTADICGYLNIPGLMLGWVDVDRDGVPEILDLSPYGLPAP
jgi:hypothetical protein